MSFANINNLSDAIDAIRVLQANCDNLQNQLNAIRSPQQHVLPKLQAQDGVRVCKCNVQVMARTVIKDGPNQGKLFWSCNSPQNCNYFKWVQSQEMPPQQQQPQQQQQQITNQQ